jgi:succinate dehydrogenase / fumarate reductase, membrane anchor subunit
MAEIKKSGASIMREWRVQRYTGALIALYVIGLLVALLVNGAPNAAQWHGLFGNVMFKLFTFAVLLALAYHALIGVLHVWPDYVKPAGAQNTLKYYSYAAAIAYAVWAVYILWIMK